MIDLETASVQPNASILTIGAIKFNSNLTDLEPMEEMDTFYRRIELESCERLGLHVDTDTLLWWAKQDKAAKHEAFTHPDRVPIGQALKEFDEWFEGAKFVWANSPSFDCVILKNAVTASGLNSPWDFWNERDCRTLYDVGRVNTSSLPKADHNALSDCYRQIRGVMWARNNLKNP